jgi:Bacteriophage Lambda NinG protein
MKRTPLKRKTSLQATTPLKRATRPIARSKGVKRPKLTPKPKTAAKLKKELDAIFSKYIRLKYSDENGNVACYTCGKVMHWKQIQNGHFISRQYLATRWHEDNCRPQCIGDNIFGNGKPLDFEERLKKDLGSQYVEDMKMLRHKSLKLDRHWYAEQIAIYQAKFDSL